MSNFDFQIGVMTTERVAEVVAIENQLYEFPWTEQNFRDSIASGYGASVLVDGRNSLIGYAVVMWVLDEVHLLNISIATFMQRKGLGLMLLRWFINQSMQRQAKGMLLEVRRSNLPALMFYQAEGFESIGERKNYYPAADGQREDAFVLFKKY